MTEQHAIQATTLLEFYDAEEVAVAARKTGFVQRQSRLDGSGMLKTCVLGYLEEPQASLNQLAQMSADLEIDITPQGLDQRITAQAVAFMEHMFARAMTHFAQEAALPLDVLQHFNGVYLTDSSVIALPDTLVTDYPGCGGDGPAASVKVQLTFEFSHHRLQQVVLRAGRDADAAYQDYAACLPAGALSITDLGYFNLHAFKHITVERGAYILSRLETAHTGLLTPDGTELDLLATARQYQTAPGEMAILLGKSPQFRLAMRLCIFPLPQEVADQRRRRAKANARRKGRTLSARYLALLSWSFFITNAPPSQLPLQAVTVLYRVRWQVELLFKLCKSYCGLKHIRGLRRERVLLEFYAKLIGVVITQFILAPLRLPEGASGNRELSPVKARQTLRRFIRDIARALHRPQVLPTVLAQLVAHMLRFGFKEIRVTEPNICQRLALVAAACGLSAAAA
jgi:hypothetical protein